MPAEQPSTILDAFALRGRRYVYLMGGGGKTSLMFALARALVGEGRTVITTTSTKIRSPEHAESARVMIEPDIAALVDGLRREIAAFRHVTVAARRLETEAKLGGFTAGELDALAVAGIADCLLVEADGAAGRSLKAHAEHEPVLSAHAELVIAVVGVDCLGLPMTDEFVHRAALFRERLGRPPGAAITADDVAAILFHREGYLARIANGPAVLVFLSKAASGQAVRDARGLVSALRERDREHRIAGIVIGDARAGLFHA